MSDWHALVVEDIADNAELVEIILEHNNISYTTTETAEEALVILESEMPSVILIDLALPGMSGWDLLKHLRSNPRTADLPMVAVTAYHSRSVAEEAITAGFDACFPKPIDPDTFVQELQRLIPT
ncbi:MAG: response regulator [Chloroflexi bacterium]|nr:response regulator [Chloroflexota bacterium]